MLSRPPEPETQPTHQKAAPNDETEVYFAKCVDALPQRDRYDTGDPERYDTLVQRAGMRDWRQLQSHADEESHRRARASHDRGYHEAVHAVILADPKRYVIQQADE
jgi:hypothetical protein